MNAKPTDRRLHSPGRKRRQRASLRSRRGIVAALAVILIPVLMVFLAFSVDTGRVSLTKAKMQTACDAASLAASQEIVASVQQAGEDGGDAADANSIAVEASRQVAVTVAAENGVFIDPQRDVHFGRAVQDDDTGEWSYEWDSGGPYNVVQVTARRDNPDPDATDARYPMVFGNFVGVSDVPLSVTSTAFIESRDLAIVLDFSGSMSYDSRYRSSSVSRLGKEAIDENKLDIYNALGPPEVGGLPWEPAGLTLVGQAPSSPREPQIQVTFTSGTEVFIESSKDLSNVVVEDTQGNTYKYDNLNQGTTGTFSSHTGYPLARVWVKSGRNASDEGPGYGERFDNSIDNVLKAYDLDTTDYPYPSGNWYDFVSYCRTSSDIRNVGYDYQYGGKCFVDYLLARRRSNSQTPDLWKTPHYPFEAVKNGCSLFFSFLDRLEFGDEVGIISYDTYHRVEDFLDPSDTDDGVGVDIRSDPISDKFDELDRIQRHKQAAHYSATTNIGGGIKEAIELLENSARRASRRTIVVMTDGNANVNPDNVSIPPGWNWADYTDYDGDGDADYSTSNTAKKSAFAAAVEGVEKGYTIHTISVGAGADRELMQALAYAGGGIWIDIPGGSTVAEMEEQLLEAFGRIAAKVPPPKLVDAPTQ